MKTRILIFLFLVGLSALRLGAQELRPIISTEKDSILIGDQINFDCISDRRLKVSNAYQSELINKDTYVQENMLISYLELFARIKLDINNYKLNKQNKITDDFSKNIFVIMQDYRRMLDMKVQKENEYYNNPVFQNEFKAKYQTVSDNRLIDRRT